MSSFGGASAAQDEHLFARKADARPGDGVFQAGVIRVVAKELAAPVGDGVHRPNAPGNGRELIQIGDDGLFIWNRDIKA